MRAILPFALLSVGLLAAAPADLTVTAAARTIQPGELVLLTIRTAAPATSLKVRAFDQDFLPFQVDGSTWRVLVGIDLAVAPGAYTAAIDAEPGSRNTTYALVVKRRPFRTRTLSVDPAFVTPPPETAERIERESRELERIWRTRSPERLWTATFVRPVPHAANSAFGTHSVFNGQPRSQHSGADFRSPAGTPVKTPNAGRVVLAAPRYFSGNTVVIDHGLGLFSLFAHLSDIRAQKGDVVAPGDVIGTVGSTGRVTGPHLHWSVRAGGARVDPLSLLSVLGPRPNRSDQKPRGRIQKLSSQVPPAGTLWSSL